MPGFNDAHVHLVEGGLSLLSIDLRHARDEKEFVRQLADYAATLPPGTWITGGSWDHERWPSKKWPHRTLVDQAVPDHPVFVVRLDWHVGVANSLALEKAGIDRHTADPPGGEIDRDPETGEPTGILLDEAHKLVFAALPDPSPEDLSKAAITGMRAASKMGLTSMQGQCSPEEARVLSGLAGSGRSTVRFCGWALPEHVKPLSEFESTAFFRLSGVKFFADGSLGAGTALLFEPYHDRPQSRGIAIHEPEALHDVLCEYDLQGHPLVVHAIGDLGVHRVLNVIESMRKRDPNRVVRYRIEHVQLCRQNDVDRFAQLGVLASIQPTHCIDDMRWIENRIGAQRIGDAYRYHSLVSAGAHVALGTDWPVEPLDPRLSIYASVAREYPEGGPSGGWMPQEKVRMETALWSYTAGSAIAEGRHHQKGKLNAGYLADFIILSDNPFEIPIAEFLHTTVDYTIMHGQVVYEQPG